MAQMPSLRHRLKRLTHIVYGPLRAGISARGARSQSPENPVQNPQIIDPGHTTRILWQ